MEAREGGSGRQPSRSSSRAAVGRFLPPPLASAALIANTTPQANRIPRHHCPCYSRPAQRYLYYDGNCSSFFISARAYRPSLLRVQEVARCVCVCVLLSYFISSACDVAASNCADPRFPLTEFGHQGSHECLPPQTPPPRRPPSHRTTHPTQLLRPLRYAFYSLTPTLRRFADIKQNCRSLLRDGPCSKNRRSSSKTPPPFPRGLALIRLLH